MLPSPAKQLALQQRMALLNIREQDLQEHFITGSGNGGQKINKTASCVSLLHTPSGIRIKTQSSRSRELNRYHARQQLCQTLEHQTLGKLSPHAQKTLKIQRQKARRKRRSRSSTPPKNPSNHSLPPQNQSHTSL